jgi:MoxR-like ATPase
LLDSHVCKIFGPLKDGDVEIIDHQPRFKEYPSKVDTFIGRQKEIYEVVHNVVYNRMVTIIGLPGIGKTALCKNAV